MPACMSMILHCQSYQGNLMSFGIQQENTNVSVKCRLCAQLLHETIQEQHGTEKHMVKWLKSFHNRICLSALLQKHCASILNKGLTDITSGLAAYGLQYQDLEWFSRAAIVSAVLKVSSLGNCSISSQCSNIDYWSPYVLEFSSQDLHCERGVSNTKRVSVPKEQTVASRIQIMQNL